MWQDTVTLPVTDSASGTHAKDGFWWTESQTTWDPYPPTSTRAFPENDHGPGQVAPSQHFSQTLEMGWGMGTGLPSFLHGTNMIFNLRQCGASDRVSMHGPLRHSLLNPSVRSVSLCLFQGQLLSNLKSHVPIHVGEKCSERLSVLTVNTYIKVIWLIN